MQFYNIIMIHVQSLKIQAIKEKKEKKTHKNQLPIMVIIHNTLQTITRINNTVDHFNFMTLFC